jgi:hypothetical protein
MNCPKASRALTSARQTSSSAGRSRGSISRSSASTCVEKLGQHVLHVFANDAAPGLGGMAGSSVELGRGTADMPELLGALEEYDYRGWVTVEQRSSRSPVEDVENAIEFLRSL